MLAFALLVLFGGLTSTHAQEQSAPTPEDDAYFLVIDRSSSMKDPGKSGKPRWQEMQEHAEAILGQLPLGSEVRATMFSDRLYPAQHVPFATEDDRAQAIRTLRKMCESPSGNTQLFDALGEIFENAESVFHGNRKRAVRVMVFTDGRDTASKKWSQSSLLARFREVINEHPDVWLFFTQIGDDKTSVREIIDHPHAVQHEFKPPILLKTSPATIDLKDPLLYPEQQFRLDLSGASPVLWRKLAGQEIRCEYLDDLGDLSAEIPSVPLQPGAATVPIRFRDVAGREPGVSRSGRIRLHFPKLNDHEIRASNLLDVEFAIRGAPAIAVESPGPWHPKRPLPVRLRNAEDAARIEWSVDGNPYSPPGAAPSQYDPTRVNIEFAKPGRAQIKAKVTWPNGAATEVTSDLDVEPSPILAQGRVELTTPDLLRSLIGGQYRLVDESAGDIVERRWYVDDQPLPDSTTSVWLRCRSAARIRLVTKGPAAPGEAAVSDEWVVMVDRAPYARWLPKTLAAIALALVGLRVGPYFLAAMPRQYRLYFSHQGVPAANNRDPSIDLGKYWQASRRAANVPLGKLFAACPHWSNGQGRKEHLIVRLRSQSPQHHAQFDYSGAHSQFAFVTPPFCDEQTGVCCRLTDNRCQDGSFRNLYFRLTAGELRRSVPRMAAFGALAAASLAGCWFLL